MPDYDPTALAQVDPAYWAWMWKIQLGSAIFSLEGREYQREPMQSKVRRLCCRKATQGGWTEINVLTALHGLIHNVYPKGILSLFPTTDNVLDFSKSRFNPLILANKEAIGKYVKVGGRGTDTAALKKIGQSFLYLRGARLSQKVGVGKDDKESAGLRGIPVDRVDFEEVDLIDDAVVQKAKGRMGDSALKQERYLSNPIFPDSGIDKIFNDSDQRYLFRKCLCGEWMCAELSFPECVHIRPDGTGFIACPKCGKEVGYQNCDWKPQKTENSDYMHGYHWSQLSSLHNDPAEILKDIQDPPLGNLADVYRLELGLPYIAAEDKLTVNQVYALCNQDMMHMSHKGPCAMGIDVGKIKHVIIGVRTGDERFQILKMIRLSEWNDIHDLARKFNVRSCVIDLYPYEDKVREFRSAETYRIFLSQYTDNAMHDATWNQDTGVVQVYRTGIFDKTHRLIDEGRLTIPRKCEEVKTFAAQACSAAKVLEVNDKTGNSVYRYRKIGSAGDHYRNALNYFILAASGAKLARVGARKNRQRVAKCEHAWA